VSPTGLARLPIVLLDRAEKLGMDRAELVRMTGLTEETLADPEARIPAAKIEALWRAMVARAPHPALGIRVGSAYNVLDWGLVGYTMTYSTTLGCALRRLVRYGRIVSETVQLELNEETGEFFADGGARFDALIHPVEARLAAALCAARQITKAEIVPREARFAHERPSDTSEYAAFFRCPLFFDRPRSSLVFHQLDLERSTSTGDETLVGYLDQLAEEALEGLGRDDSFAAKVRKAIWPELNDGHPSLKRTAKALGMSVRTLQRRLREEGQTFAGTLEALRRELATGLLRHRELSVSEVAFLLGYSEPSTFHRAFRRWHDRSPQEFRRELD